MWRAFNQFFDDTNATDAWRYGAAIDQIFSKSLYGGAEYTYRDLDVPSSGVTVGLDGSHNPRLPVLDPT